MQPHPWHVLTFGALICTAVILQAQAGGQPCSRQTFEGDGYTVCTAPLKQFEVRTFWQKPDGRPYKYLSALPDVSPASGRLAFALNGGMFDPDYRPVGLYVEDARQLVAANTRSGSGNFHIKPNGIFFAGVRGAGVMETGAFLKQRPQALYATQSGPMLVADGRINPRIAHASSSAKARDAVCVRNGDAAVFAISDGDVPFSAFARFLRDGLKCRNALFLDGGSAPALYVPSASRAGNTFLPLGPMIAVYEKDAR